MYLDLRRIKYVRVKSLKSAYYWTEKGFVILVRKLEELL
jgi:hypothetical protein